MSPPASDAPTRSDLYELSVRYAAAVDERDGDEFADLFEPDGELVVPDFPRDLRPVTTRSGREQLRRVPRALEGYVLTFHQVANAQFGIDGDRAQGDVQCIAHHLSGSPPEATDTVWFIRYRDSYRRRAGVWRFVRRVLLLQWVERHPVDQMAASGPAGSEPERRA